jgi:hypothetical protein
MAGFMGTRTQCRLAPRRAAGLRDHQARHANSRSQKQNAQRRSTCAVHRRARRRDFVLRDDRVEPRNVLQQALTGEDEKIIAKLRILEVNLEQLLVGDGQNLAVFDTFDCRRSAVVGCQETKLAHQTSRRKFDAYFLHQEFSELR